MFLFQFESDRVCDWTAMQVLVQGIEELRRMPTLELTELHTNVVTNMCSIEKKHEKMLEERDSIVEDLRSTLQGMNIVCEKNDNLVVAITNALKKSIERTHKNLSKFEHYKKFLLDIEYVLERR